MEEKVINNELISVIVPIYNVEKYLEKCVNSILKQTYTNLEIILVDDGSPDRCPKICDNLAIADDRIKVIHQQNGGLSKARNVGIDVAKGAYLVFVDSDDTVEYELIEKLYKCLKKYDCKMAACGRKYVFEDGKVICKVPEGIDTVYEFEDAIKEMNTFRLFDMSAWAKIYAKELFSTIRFPEGKLSEDYFVMYKLIDLAHKIGYISEPLYNYLQRTSSISRNKKINHDFIEAAQTQMDYLDDKYPDLKQISHTAFASANLTVYDFYIKNGVKCSKVNKEKFRKNVQNNIEYIDSNINISLAKKIQFKLFMKSYFLYNIVFKLYRKMRRV